ncbi:hypothetical protein ACFWJT_15650 [Streptomyces sp. NPDC127069]|uniref:hypothetical protein n=1 Tax=Streptomyces sp. NPDC127069 TaxID=3347128 RepID=UPI0036525CA0
MTTALDRVTATRWDTENAWRLYDAPGKYGALLGDWTTTQATDSQPLIITTVRGRQAELALIRFGAHHGLILTATSDQKPVLAYTDHGATLTWRTGGVWVQLATA